MARVYVCGARRLTFQPSLASSWGMQYSSPRSCASRQMRATLAGENPVHRISLVASSLDPSLMRPDSTMLVLTKVGHNPVTLTAVPDNSAASVSDSDSTPALLTLQAAIPGAAPNAAAEATLMMPRAACDGPASRRIGVKTWQPWIGPHKLTPKAHAQSSRDASPMAAPPAPTPALLITSVGGAENQDSDWSARAHTSSNRDTSQRIATALAPRSAIASTVSWAAASLTSLPTTGPPRRASSIANAAPMPLPAPVTTAEAPWLVVFDWFPSLPSGPSISQLTSSARTRVSCNAWAMNRATYAIALAASGVIRGNA